MRSQTDRVAIGGYWLSRDPKSPNWCRTWYDPQRRQTRRSSLGTTDPDEATCRLAEWFVLNQKLSKEPSDTVPLAVILDRYLKEHAADTPSEQQAKIAVRYWKEYYGAETVVSQLTIERQENFIAKLRKLKLSDWYIARTIGVGKAALNRACKRQELASAPFVLTVPDGGSRERVLSLDESVALWKAVDAEHVGAFLAVAFNTASRPDAILDLDAGQIDTERRLVNLNPPGRKQTKKYRPVVPMTRDLLPFVQDRTGPIVAWRGAPLASIKTGWRALRRRAGLDVEVIPYTIRHTMASEMRAADVAPWEVAGFLGHKIAELRTTERYAKFSPSYLGGAREAIDAYMARLRLLQRSSNATTVQAA